MARRRWAIAGAILGLLVLMLAGRAHEAAIENLRSKAFLDEKFLGKLIVQVELPELPEGEPALPPLAVRRLGSLKWQFPSPVTGLAYSADGKWLVTCDYSHVYVFDPATGKELRRFRPQHKLGSNLALANNGQVALTGYDKIHIWDAATGESVRSFPGFITGSVACSADGKLIAGLGGLKVDNDPRDAFRSYYNAFIWDATTGKPLPAFAGGIKGAMSVAVAPDGKTIAWRKAIDELHVADLDGKERYLIKAPVLRQKILPNNPNPLIPMYALAFSPDSKTLAFGTADGLVLVDTATGKKETKCVRKDPVHALQNIRTILFTPAGDRVVSVDEVSPAEVFEVASGQQIASFSAASVDSLAIAPDGKILAAAFGQSVGFTDLASGKLTAEPGWRRTIFRAALSPDGKTAASASADGQIRLWDCATGEVKHVIEHKPIPDGLLLSPDSKTLIANEGAGGGKICFWDVRTGTAQERKLLGAANARCLALSPDGKTLVAGGDNGAINLWDLPSGKHSSFEVSGKGMVVSMAFNGDGKRLVAASGSCYLLNRDKQGFTITHDNAVYLLDVTNHKEIRRLGTNANAQQPALAALISPDGKLIGAISTVVSWAGYWDADTGKELQGFAGTAAGLFSTLAISPDGKTLAMATGGYHPNPDTLARIHLFDVPSMKEIQVLEGHLQRICSLSFSADSHTLLSASMDGTSLLWDMRKVKR